MMKANNGAINKIIQLDTSSHKKLPNIQYKYLGMIQMLYVTALLATVSLTYKIVKIGAMILPGGVFVFPMTYFFGDVIAEVYGYAVSRQLIWNGLICESIFCGCCSIIIQFPSPLFWHNQFAYEIVFGHATRFFFANMIATICGSFINIYVISKWKVLMNGKFFWLRSLGSTSIGEAVFTLLVASIAFVGVIPLHVAIKTALSMYIFKLLYALIAVWIASILVVLLKAKEGIDVYDYNTDFNPFIYSVGKNNIIGYDKFKSKMKVTRNNSYDTIL